MKRVVFRNRGLIDLAAVRTLLFGRQEVTTNTLEALLERWDSGDGKPYKGSLIDWDAYEANPDSLGCMCAQGQVLNVIRGMTPQEINDIADQREADTLVMETLGISRGQAILLRNINDSVGGAPSVVLTHPEKVLGDQAQAVLAFFKYLDSMTNADWQNYFAARAAAWDAAGESAWAAARDAAWDAAGDAAWAAARAAAWDAARDAAWDAAGDAARDAAWDAARDAARAANEIQGASILTKAGKPLFFLALFGFKTVEALLDWANQ